MPYVYSTMSADVAYTDWLPRTEGQHFDVPAKRVLIKGGHGVAGKHFITPRGVATQVTEEELALLEKNETFQRHMQAGFISVSDKKRNTEVVSADMTTFDRSKDATPLVPGEFKNTKANVVELDNVGSF